MTINVFLILFLTTTIGSLILYQKTNQDIYRVLAVFTAVVCIIWGLVIAHWAIHILSLIAIVVLGEPLMKMVQATNK